MGLRRIHLVSYNVDLSSIQTLLSIDRQALNRSKLCLSVSLSYRGEVEGEGV